MLGHTTRQHESKTSNDERFCRCCCRAAPGKLAGKDFTMILIKIYAEPLKKKP